jgi:hypothetical protein
MPFTADQIINKRIRAKLPVKKLSSNLKEIGTIQPGIIGTVFSYIVRDGVVYWMIGNDFKKGAFLVKHNSRAIALDEADREEIERKEKEKRESEEIEQKGTIPFYIEKYGKTLLLFGLAGIALREIIRKQ